MKRGTPEHPKTLDLAQKLGASRPVAVGVLECLWHFTAKYAPAGDIGRWTDQAIAQGIGWDGDAALLVRSLCASGWLEPHPEHRLLVHHWSEHADDAVNTLLCRALRDFADGTRPSDKRLSRKERAQLNKKRTERAHGVRTESAQPSPAVAVALAVPLPEPCRSDGPSPPPAPPKVEQTKPLTDEYRRTYAREVQRELNERRGSELPEMTSADWSILSGWIDSGVPLRVVLTGIRECNGKPRELTLRYCRPAIDAEVTRVGRALGAGW